VGNITAAGTKTVTAVAERTQTTTTITITNSTAASKRLSPRVLQVQPKEVTLVTPVKQVMRPVTLDMPIITQLDMSAD